MRRSASWMCRGASALEIFPNPATPTTDVGLPKGRVLVTLNASTLNCNARDSSLNLEGFRVRQATVAQSTVPTVAVKTGNFSGGGAIGSDLNARTCRIADAGNIFRLRAKTADSLAPPPMAQVLLVRASSPVALARRTPSRLAKIHRRPRGGAVYRRRGTLRLMVSGGQILCSAWEKVASGLEIAPPREEEEEEEGRPVRPIQ